MLDLFVSEAFAMAPPAGGEGGNPIMSFMPLILMFAIFYFLLIRPQQKKAKKHREMLAGLQKGDYIITGGGVYGRIMAVSGEVLSIEIAPETTIKVNRGFVSGLADAGEKAPKEKSKGE